MRDIAAQHCYLAESFETSVPWSKVTTLCAKVRERLIAACVKQGVDTTRMLVSFRVTQVYETGAAVYIYFGYNYAHSKIPADRVIQAYEDIENETRDEILKQGGSLSHHHGIGKIRKRFTSRIMPGTAVDLLGDLKKSLDPKNVFSINNTIYRLPNEEADELSGKHHNH